MLGIIVDRTVKRAPTPEVSIADAPRKVRLRPEAGKRLRLLRVMALVALICGVWMAWASLKAPLTHSFGDDKTAKVEAVSPVAGDKLARWFDVKFSYEIGTRRHFGEGKIDMAGDHAPLVGSGIAIK